jgi:hypothetical protein
VRVPKKLYVVVVYQTVIRRGSKFVRCKPRLCVRSEGLSASEARSKLAFWKVMHNLYAVKMLGPYVLEGT